MKQISTLIAAAILGGALPAGAVLFLPTPVPGETVKNDDGTFTINWTYDDSEEPCSGFVITLFKTHKAVSEESFVLAESNFDCIESTGTMKKAQNKGAAWDFIPGLDGWIVKFPMYMEGAIGIDAFFYYAGSDNSDIFGGCYFISPDYDLSGMSDPKLLVEADLANEAESVSGGFVLYTWNTDWWDEKNIDYKPVIPTDSHFDDLTNNHWTHHSEELEPDEFMNRTRVCFYGVGHSTYWVDNVKVTAPLNAGDKIDYCATSDYVDNNTFTYTFAQAPENEDQYYAFQVRAIKVDYDEYRELNYVRFVSNIEKKRSLDNSGVEIIEAPEDNFDVRTADGAIIINGAGDANVSVFSASGETIYNGPANMPIRPASKGIYIVKVANKAVKVAL